MNIVVGYLGRRGWFYDDDVRETVGVCAAGEEDRAAQGAFDGGRRDHVRIAVSYHGPDEYRGRIIGCIGQNALRKVVDALLEVRCRRRAADGEHKSREHNEFQHHLYMRKK